MQISQTSNNNEHPLITLKEKKEIIKLVEGIKEVLDNALSEFEKVKIAATYKQLLFVDNTKLQLSNLSQMTCLFLRLLGEQNAFPLNEAVEIHKSYADFFERYFTKLHKISPEYVVQINQRIESVAESKLFNKDLFKLPDGTKEPLLVQFFQAAGTLVKFDYFRNPTYDKVLKSILERNEQLLQQPTYLCQERKEDLLSPEEIFKTQGYSDQKIQALYLKYWAHIENLMGTFLKPNGKENELEGLWEFQTLEFFIYSIKHLNKHLAFDNLIAHQLANRYLTVLELTLESCKKIAYRNCLQVIDEADLEEICRRYENNLPVLLHLGWIGHSVYGIFSKGHFAYINTASENESGIILFNITKPFTPDVVSTLLSHNLTESDIATQFFEKEQSGGMIDLLGLQKALTLPWKGQIVGNCSRAGLDPAVFSILFMIQVNFAESSLPSTLQTFVPGFNDAHQLQQLIKWHERALITKTMLEKQEASGCFFPFDHFMMLSKTFYSNLTEMANWTEQPSSMIHGLQQEIIQTLLTHLRSQTFDIEDCLSVEFSVMDAMNFLALFDAGAWYIRETPEKEKFDLVVSRGKNKIPIRYQIKALETGYRLLRLDGREIVEFTDFGEFIRLPQLKLTMPVMPNCCLENNYEGLDIIPLFERMLGLSGQQGQGYQREANQKKAHHSSKAPQAMQMISSLKMKKKELLNKPIGSTISSWSEKTLSGFFCIRLKEGILKVHLAKEIYHDEILFKIKNSLWMTHPDCPSTIGDFIRFIKNSLVYGIETVNFIPNPEAVKEMNFRDKPVGFYILTRNSKKDKRCYVYSLYIKTSNSKIKPINVYRDKTTNEWEALIGGKLVPFDLPANQFLKIIAINTLESA